MKHSFSILTTSLLVIVNLYMFAQQRPSYKDLMQDPNVNFYDVCRSADTYFETHSKGKGSGWIGYERWKNESEPHYYPSGERNRVSQDFVSNEYKSFINSSPMSSQRGLNFGGWHELGPFNANNITQGYNPGIGRVEAFWVDPMNSNHIFLGSRSGGFWKTTDGGANWTNTTDTLFASGVNTITASPGNSDNVLINVRNSRNGSSHGVYQSTNGGDNWNLTNFNPSKLGWGGLGTIAYIYKIVYHPTVSNLVFVGTSNGLYRSTDNLQTWTKLLATSNITSIEFHPTDSNILYVYDTDYNNNFRNVVLRSTDIGLTFSPSNTIAGNNGNIGYISTSKTAPSNVYFASTNGVWRSTNEGQNFTFLSTPSENCRGFAVSDLDSNAMVYGYLNLQASVDGGFVFNTVAKWSNKNPGNKYVHADLRIAGCVNGVFYVGTDGYLSKSPDNGSTWQRLNDGTSIREFYAAGVSQSNYNTYMAGSQDNGTSILNENGWIEWNGGDGMEALIQPLNPNWMIGSWQYGSRNITKDGGLTRQSVNNPGGGSGKAAWQAPMLLDPNQQMAIFHFSDRVYQTDSFGTYWKEIGSPGLGQIKVAAIAENNSNIMVVASGSGIVLTENRWQTSRKLDYQGVIFSYVSDIAFDPTNDSTLIVTYNLFSNDGKKVFISYDLGLTWDNITYNLGNMPIRTVVVDHSNKSNIYLGAEIGIYVKSMNDTVWELYNPNFPNVTVNDLEIQYGSNTIKAATWGRGLWEFHLKGRANYPSVLTTTITNPPTDIFPKAGSEQFVTSVISYDKEISSAFVKWSNGTTGLDQIIKMINPSDSTWVSEDPIKNFGQGTNIYFKVFVVGQDSDTTETYRFHYKVRNGLIINGISQKLFEEDIQLFPNPNSGNFEIKLGREYSDVNIQIFSSDGKRVFQNSESGALFNVDIDIPAGNYILSVSTGDKNARIKFVVK